MEMNFIATVRAGSLTGTKSGTSADDKVKMTLKCLCITTFPSC